MKYKSKKVKARYIQGYACGLSPIPGIPTTPDFDYINKSYIQSCEHIIFYEL